MAQRIKVAGLRELRRQMRRVELVTKAEMRQRVRERARQMAGRARDLAPIESGDLRDKIEARDTADGAEVVAGAAHTIHVEFGTSEQSPQPMLRPAAAEARRNLAADVDDVARKLEGL